jgi:formylglycine-generating enzyme required for sulfatase activity
VIRILDSELRLITPTDPEASETADVPTPKVEAGQKYYQLTHDYLVPSLRDWLTRKQKETRRGRAELRLDDRAALWSAKPENRHLPSLWEFLNIRLLTDRKKWTAPQRKMMGKAGRVYGIRSGLVGLGIVVLIAMGLVIRSQIEQRENRNYASALVQSLLAANTPDVADLIGEIDKYHRWATPLLLDIVNSDETTPKQKLHASVALMKNDPSQVDFVFEQLVVAPVESVPIIVTLLKPHRERVEGRLWDTVKTGTSSQRLRAAAALAAYDSGNPNWQKVRSDVVTALVSVTPTESRPWMVMLRPVGTKLVEPLQTRYRDRSPQRDSERPLAAAAIADYLKDQPKKLTELILLADNDREFLPFLEALRPHRNACVEEFRTLVRQFPPPTAKVDVRDAFWKKQANAAICLLGLDEREAVWPLLKHSPNPSLKSFIVDRLARLGADYRTLAERLEEEADPSIRQALILALGDFDAGKLSGQERESLVEKLLALYGNDPDPGVHSAARWALRRYQSDQAVIRLDAELQKNMANEGGKNRHWFINSQGQTFIVVDGPVNFVMGDEANFGEKKITITHRFAVDAHEVTVEQFRKFRSGYTPDTPYSPQPDCPANNVSWYDAAAYCNWLSQQEGIPKEQWCYEPNEQGQYESGMKILADYVKRSGFRLPTEAEWEYFCRAKTSTSFCFGEPEELMGKYAWYVHNSENRLWPVGCLRPNSFGAFDMHGNAWEWCQDGGRRDGKGKVGGSEMITNFVYRVMRGVTFTNQPRNIRSANRAPAEPGQSTYIGGFRPARTYP